VAKPKALKFKGRTTKNELGSDVPDRYFSGVPARDLGPVDIARLDAETLKTIMTDPGNGDGPLYVVDEAEEQRLAEAEEAAAKAKEAETKKTAAEASKTDNNAQAEKAGPTQAAGS
jgi:hypothetical protein